MLYKPEHVRIFCRVSIVLQVHIAHQRILYYSGGNLTNQAGHAVVLINFEPDCLTFMNSWGTDFADGGFFRIKDQSVLHDFNFYDVYWEIDDLTNQEKQAFKEEGARRGKELLQTFTSLNNLLVECPKCNKNSKVVDYSGNLLEARCPKCNKKFKPKNKHILRSLYNNNMQH